MQGRSSAVVAVVVVVVAVVVAVVAVALAVVGVGGLPTPSLLLPSCLYLPPCQQVGTLPLT